MLFLMCTKEKNVIKESDCMLNDEICELRDRLNASIAEGKDYAIIYELSVELDGLIAKFYEENYIKSTSKT